MRLISWNVNGIRAVERKQDLQSFLQDWQPDILLLQETKAKPEQLSALLTQHPEYHQFYHAAQQPGYSGTAIWARKDKIATPQFQSGMPDFDDAEGRVAQLDFLDYSILGVYFPNGGKSPEAWQGKLVFYERFLAYVNQLRADGRKVIWGGDVNCAHQPIDLARPQDNEQSIGFLPEERDWVSRVIAQDWVDIFRQRNPTTVIYSWWHVITKARARNIGWRIDYFFVDSCLQPQVSNSQYLNQQMGSDHCPVLLELEL